ncbi:hypothetical protein [Deinococcus marmoris]|uniref:Uncharacterized protein n=1 Tax=Deinococcus marmoris TaxID=249408 RepID=A0A1U7P4W4_9DEIO|nr:hypothetical protein [Deinococcus marmoris]OLV20198.1 hypothetical protein BOO71_0000622 [Deinococcus marmoris]
MTVQAPPPTGVRLIDHADRLKAHLRARHASNAPAEEIKLLLGLWETLMDLLSNSLHEEVPGKFRMSYPRKRAEPAPQRPVSFRSTLHDVLLVCLDQPLGVRQIAFRYEQHWDRHIADDQLRTSLHRLCKHGFLERAAVGEYCLTGLGRHRLDELEVPPVPSAAGPAADLLRALLDKTYQPQLGEHHATFSAEALERALDILEGTLPPIPDWRSP